ncbi:hypothetical protein [Chryseobacterium oryctis]|uniref:Uncharacterized protein n=1 Tax=Chryseobacterium oryctis TaxID=2952618 RepID=A0ABT3HP15_9FLAO|nr:hypothetical protein [Chryseobacterium oryctis]MCW3161523.1 hypothetical protein [Chryseobacterium oryctis]
MKKDEDVSFLNGQLKIENGVLVVNEFVLKQNENEDIDELKKIIEDIEKVDSTFEEDYLYLNSNYHVVYSDKINLNDYSYDKMQNQYNGKKELHEDLTTIYKFDKIKSIEKPVKNLKFYNAESLKTKCLRTPYIIKKEEDEKYRETYPMKTVEIKPL